MVQFRPPRSLGLWLVAASVAACGSVGQHLPPPVEPPPPNDAYRVLLMASPSPEESAVLGQYLFLASIRLTKAQVPRLVATIKRMSASEAPRLRLESQFLTLMQAPKVDQSALRKLATEAWNRKRVEAVQGTTTLAAVRAELTDSQRRDASRAVLLAPSLATSPTPGPPSGLTAKQQALFQAANPPQVSQDVAAKALAAFLRTGDLKAYQAATLPAWNTSAKVEALVSAIASLTPAQRRAMFSGVTPAALL